MLRRLLNIASIVCLVLCVALMGMWVRSYWHADSLTRVSKDGVLTRFGTASGTLFFAGLDYQTTSTISSPDETNGWEYQEYDMTLRDVPRWDFNWGATERVVALPAWFATLFFFILAIAPWIPWSGRFSLRTMLIATTFLAVALGMIAVLDREWIRK
jgi:hypothetical protein